MWKFSTKKQQPKIVHQNSQLNQQTKPQVQLSQKEKLLIGQYRQKLSKLQMDFNGTNVEQNNQLAAKAIANGLAGEIYSKFSKENREAAFSTLFGSGGRFVSDVGWKEANLMKNGKMDHGGPSQMSMWANRGDDVGDVQNMVETSLSSIVDYQKSGLESLGFGSTQAQSLAQGNEQMMREKAGQAWKGITGNELYSDEQKLQQQMDAYQGRSQERVETLQDRNDFLDR